MFKNSNNNVNRRLISTVSLIFILMALMLVYIFTSFYRSSFNNIMDLGVSNMNSQATMIENYINTGRDILWVTADTVKYMLENNMSEEEILRYLKKETK